MKNYKKFSAVYRKLLISFLILIPWFAQGAQIVGGQITYTCIAKDSFQVKLSLYADCIGSHPGNTQTINVFSGGCGILPDVILTKISSTGNDVTPLCPGWVSPCASSGSVVPMGIEEHIFKGLLVLPSAPSKNNCETWTLGFSHCCRKNTSGSASQNFYISTQINQFLQPCNNSPQFLNVPVPFICSGLPFKYNHGMYDPDGDSLSFSLVACRTSPVVSVVYVPPLSSAKPLHTIGNISIDSMSGIISLTPNQPQIGVLCIKVNEYRNGIKIGEIIRDFTFVVLDCDSLNNPPQASGINGIQGLYDTIIEPGRQYNFNFYTSDPNPGDFVTVSITTTFTGYNFHISNDPLPEVLVMWTPTKADVGNHKITLNLYDDGCPINEMSEFIYHLNVQPKEAKQGYQFRTQTSNQGDIVVPFAFNPDSHIELNRKFIVLSHKGIEMISLQVNAPNGDLLYQSGSTSVTDGWDGTFMGKLMPVGTYLYMVSGKYLLTGENYFKTGPVVLIRK